MGRAFMKSDMRIPRKRRLVPEAMRPAAWFVLSAAVLSVSAFSPAGARAAGEGRIFFGRDVLPILSENCFLCHGPDPSSRKADLRLDLREEALRDLGGRAAVVPGAPGESELLFRVTAEDAFERMPPAESGKTLSPEEIATLRAWIEEGAEWSEHWAFEAPADPPVPELSSDAVRAADDAEWKIRNPIDSFVLARLERENLRPSPEADRVTLLRRLCLDLTGLPPSVLETDDYLADEPEAGYDRAVRRLLGSPAYGERQARHWLDAAQYADSDGFEKDKPREVWAWRDWVVGAFNDNMPYDRFILEQIAGDLLPGATPDQVIATGFLRNSMINEEGGIDPEQFRTEALFNRMEVIGGAVLGLTLRCAQCHDHKYDPLSQTEYFRLMAFINSAHEACVTVYTDEQEERRAETMRRLDALDDAFRRDRPAWREEMAQWEESLRAAPQPEWKALEFEFDDTSAGGQKFLPRGGGAYLAAGYAPTRFRPKMSAPNPLRRVTAVRLELLTDPELPHGGPGRSIYGSLALTEFELYSAPAGTSVKDLGSWTRVEIASAVADVNPPKRPLGPEFPQGANQKSVTGPVSMAIDGDNATAWTIDNGPGRRNQPREAVFVLKEPLVTEEGFQLAVIPAQNHGGNDSNNFQNNNLGRFRISVTGAADLPGELAPVRAREIASRAAGERTPDEETYLFRAWRAAAYPLTNMPVELAWKSHPVGASQLVYLERDAPRVTRRFERGEFLHPAEEVEPGVPAFLHPMPDDLPRNRLGLARWFTDPASPTTARSFVNRIWQNCFGTGLVETAQDFGVQGEQPTHPELLDWLATRFVESGWDVKELYRLIVTSATYRQSSRVGPGLLERDPDNRLLARGARFRVEGEIVRDIALSASGLLSAKMGGPPVHPPAPEFLFLSPACYGTNVWNVPDGEDRYRRGGGGRKGARNES